MQKIKTKQLAFDAMFAAMTAVLSYLALDLGNLKITFEGLPLIVGALLFGPVDGFLIGAVGTFISQLLKYGITITTPLWIAPYAISGLFLGFLAKKTNFNSTKLQLLIFIIINELMVTALNTLVMYIDAKLYGYYTPQYIFGSLVVRIILSAAKGIVYGILVPVILKALHRAIKF